MSAAGDESHELACRCACPTRLAQSGICQQSFWKHYSLCLWPSRCVHWCWLCELERNVQHGGIDGCCQLDNLGGRRVRLVEDHWAVLEVVRWAYGLMEVVKNGKHMTADLRLTGHPPAECMRHQLPLEFLPVAKVFQPNMSSPFAPQASEGAIMCTLWQSQHDEIVAE